MNVVLENPPVFSPRVCNNELRTSDTPESHSSHVSRHLISDTAYPVALIAKKYNIHITWIRLLNITVHEGKDLVAPCKAFGLHDVVCKIDVGGQIGRTKPTSVVTETTCSWNETLKFHVGDPCNIKMLVYCRNSVVPNAKLGFITISPCQVVEGATVTEWFPISTEGKVKLSIFFLVKLIPRVFDNLMSNFVTTRNSTFQILVNCAIISFMEGLPLAGFNWNQDIHDYGEMATTNLIS